MFDRDEQEISQIIDNGLEAIRTGRATLEQVLEQQELLGQHPLQAEALRAELKAGVWLIAKRKEVEPRPGFVSASRTRVLERIQAEARSQGTKHAFFGFAWPKRLTFQWAVAALVFLLVLAGTGGIVKASQAALPGENLYAVKRASEQVAYTVTLGEVQRVELSQRFANQRLNEVEQLVADGKFTEAKETLTSMEQQVNQAVAQLGKVDKAQAQAKVAAAEKLKADLSRNNDRLANLMASAPPDVQGKLQEAMTVTALGASTAGDIIDSTLPLEATPTPTITLTPTDASTATPEEMDSPEPEGTPEPDGSPGPAGLSTPFTDATVDDEMETPTPTPDDASKTPKPSHTPKVNDNNGNNSSKQPDNPNKPDKPPKDPPPGKKK